MLLQVGLEASQENMTDTVTSGIQVIIPECAMLEQDFYCQTLEKLLL